MHSNCVMEFFSDTIRSLYLFTQVKGTLNNLSLPYNNVFLLLFYKLKLYFHLTPFEQTVNCSASCICVNRTITLNVVRRKSSQITEDLFSL